MGEDGTDTRGFPVTSIIRWTARGLSPRGPIRWFSIGPTGSRRRSRLAKAHRKVVTSEGCIAEMTAG